MNAITQALHQRRTLNGIFIDIFALAFIYLIPTISHLVLLPVYYMEPMRLMIILALVHSNKMNGYLLAATLPVFSLLVSGHPDLPKMILIAVELTLNVFLFYLLSKGFKYLFPAIFISIILSKIVYYFLKYLMIEMTVIDAGLITTPILIQIFTALVFSCYLVIFYKRSSKTGSLNG